MWCGQLCRVLRPASHGDGGCDFRELAFRPAKWLHSIRVDSVRKLPTGRLSQWDTQVVAVGSLLHRPRLVQANATTHTLTHTDTRWHTHTQRTSGSGLFSLVFGFVVCVCVCVSVSTAFLFFSLSDSSISRSQVKVIEETTWKTKKTQKKERKKERKRPTR